jgi:hypothetical protein
VKIIYQPRGQNFRKPKITIAIELSSFLTLKKVLLSARLSLRLNKVPGQDLASSQPRLRTSVSSIWHIRSHSQLNSLWLITVFWTTDCLMSICLWNIRLLTGTALCIHLSLGPLLSLKVRGKGLEFDVQMMAQSWDGKRQWCRRAQKRRSLLLWENLSLSKKSLSSLWNKIFQQKHTRST